MNKVIKYLTIFSLLLIFSIACRRVDSQKNQNAIEERLKKLETRIASLERGITKPSSEVIAQKEEERGKEEKIKAEINEEKVGLSKEAKKNKPDSFFFPDYKLEIRNFNYRMSEGGIIEYYGVIINKSNKNINDLSLITEFYDYEGSWIGGHPFPIKLIFANKERKFSNSDSVRGGFKNIYRYDIKVKYIVYEGGQLTEGEEEKFSE